MGGEYFTIPPPAFLFFFKANYFCNRPKDGFTSLRFSSFKQYLTYHKLFHSMKHLVEIWRWILRLRSWALLSNLLVIDSCTIYWGNIYLELAFCDFWLRKQYWLLLRKKTVKYTCLVQISRFAGYSKISRQTGSLVA